MMTPTRLSRSFSCSTVAFPPASSVSDSGHSFGQSRGREREYEYGSADPLRRKSTLKTNSSLSLRRMSTFARFLRKSTSDGNKVYKAGKLIKTAKGPAGPEWISSPRDYTSCTLCDRFFVSGEDWLEVCPCILGGTPHCGGRPALSSEADNSNFSFML